MVVGPTVARLVEVGGHLQIVQPDKVCPLAPESPLPGVGPGNRGSAPVSEFLRTTGAPVKRRSRFYRN